MKDKYNLNLLNKDVVIQCETWEQLCSLREEFFPEKQYPSSGSLYGGNCLSLSTGTQSDWNYFSTSNARTYTKYLYDTIFLNTKDKEK